MEVSAFRGSTPANISAPSLDGKGGDEPDAREHERGVEPMTAEILTLRGAIEHLPTEQRQVIELKYLVGMTNEEVAAAMGTTPGAVNAKQWRALKALADVLEERARASWIAISAPG